MTRSGSRRRRPTPRTRRVRVGRSVAFSAGTSDSRTGVVSAAGSVPSVFFLLRVPALEGGLTAAPSGSSEAGRADRRRGRRTAGTAALAEEAARESSRIATGATGEASTGGASSADPFDTFARERDRPRPPRRRRRRGAVVAPVSAAPSSVLVEPGSSETVPTPPFPTLSRTAVGARPRGPSCAPSAAGVDGAPPSPARRLRPRPPRRRRRRGAAPVASTSELGASPLCPRSTSSSGPSLVSSITRIPSFSDRVRRKLRTSKGGRERNERDQPTG